MPDYELNEKIIPAKIDPFEYITQQINYRNDKAIRAWNDVNSGKVVMIMYHDTPPTYYYQIFFVLGTSSLIYEIGTLETTNLDFTDDLSWTGGQYLGYYSDFRDYPVEFVDLENTVEYDNVDNDYKSYYYLAQTYSSCAIIKSSVAVYRSTILNYLKNTYYDQLDLELKPVPSSYGLTTSFEMDEYGQKLIVREDMHRDYPSEKETDLWFSGQFPFTPNFHMMFIDGFSHYMPNQFMLDEYVNDAIGQFYPDYIFGAMAYSEVWQVKIILPRYSTAAYGKEDQFHPVDYYPFDYIQAARLYYENSAENQSWSHGPRTRTTYEDLKTEIGLPNGYPTSWLNGGRVAMDKSYGLYVYMFTSGEKATVAQFARNISRWVAQLRSKQRLGKQLTPASILGGGG